MKKIILALIVCFSVTYTWAQSHEEGSRISPQEFRAKQETYLTEKAELTKEEAALFFPLYNELQLKKREMHDSMRTISRKGKGENVTEAQYDEINNKVLDLRLASEKLDKVYYGKFRKHLSAAKLYKIQYAEMKFHRELLKKVGKGRGPKQ